MKTLPPLEPQSTPSTVKTNPKTAAHWVHQLVSLFPPPPPPGTSQEALRAMTLIFTQYPETVLQEAVNPLTGLPSLFKYLPSLKELGDYCRDKDAEISTRNLRIKARENLIKGTCPEKISQTSLYNGLIEQIKPGDIISWDRFEEYRTYMRSAHGFDPGRPIGFYEEWRDTGRRPFKMADAAGVEPAAGLLPQSASDEPNPFDE